MPKVIAARQPRCSVRAASSMVVLLMLSASLTGCFGDDPVPAEPEEEGLPEGWFVTGGDGLPVDMEPLNLSFVFSDVGEDGAEPSIGVTSSGCIFFIAFEKVMRSCDHGQSWEDVTGWMCAFQTNDPWGWVDPVTDRIFNVQMQGLETSWICYSDDDGLTWVGNCLLYTSPSPRDLSTSRMPSSA